MVLWELTLATAYFLGLRRTYRLALKLQRRLLKKGGRYPRLRDFAHRRTRNIFDIALSFHEKVQRQDLLAGRSLGNYILRLLDRMRPAANITGSTGSKNEASQGKFPLSRLEADSKQADREDVLRTGLGGKQSEGSKGTGRGRFFTSQPINCSRFGLAIRRKITGGLGGIMPGLKVRSLPGLAFGLWWQPIRQNMEVLHSQPMSSVLYSPVSLKIPPGHYHLKEFSHMPSMIIREDIARWMKL